MVTNLSPSAVMAAEYDSKSLDRPNRKIKRQSTRRKKKEPVPERTGNSMEDLNIIGTKVKEIPSEFLVSLDPSFFSLNNQVMDIPVLQNGDNDKQFLSGVEGKIREANRRLSKRRNNPSSSQSTEDTDDTAITFSVDASSPVPQPPSHHTKQLDTAEEEVTDGEKEGTRSSVHLSSKPLLHLDLPSSSSSSSFHSSSSSGLQRLSADSGIAIQDINERDIASHGNSTENTPTDTPPRGTTELPSNHLLPPSGLSRNKFDSLKYGTKKARDSMLLSHLCVVTVTLPADIQQGQKGRGAVLKFRFSPYTQIETLRLAILKVR